MYNIFSIFKGNSWYCSVLALPSFCVPDCCVTIEGLKVSHLEPAFPSDI